VNSLWIGHRHGAEKAEQGFQVRHERYGGGGRAKRSESQEEIMGVYKKLLKRKALGVNP